MRTNLDKNNTSSPIYSQVCDIIIEAIKNGEFKAGEMFISERKLMELLKVSRDTVRKAFDRLQELGYLKKEHGRGTFVQMPNISNNSPWKYEDYNNSRIITHVVYFRIIACPADLQEKMQLTSKDFVYKIIRVRRTEEEILLMDYNYLNYYHFEGLARQDVENNSLYTIINQWYRTPLTKAEDIFQFERVNEFEANHLKCDVGAFCMTKTRFSYFDDKIVFVSKTITLNEKIQFKSIIHSKL